MLYLSAKMMALPETFTQPLTQTLTQPQEKFRLITIPSDVRVINIHTHPHVISNYSPFDKLAEIFNNRSGVKLLHIIDRFTKMRETGFMKNFNQTNPQVNIDKETKAFEDAFEDPGICGYAGAKRVFSVMMLMDFDHAGFGEDFSPQYQYSVQCKNALKLALAPENKGYWAPAYGVDPRRENFMDEIKTYWKENPNFNTFKIYPSLGFPAYHPDLMEQFYPWAQKVGAAIITHSGTGGFGTIQNPINIKGLGEMQFKSFLHPFSPELKPWFNHPKNWEKVLIEFPDLNLDLAHFGGAKDLLDYINGRAKSDNCTAEILFLCRNLRNVYTDISYTLFNEVNLKNIYKVMDDSLKSRNERYSLYKKILFGTDFDLVEMDKPIEQVIRDFFYFFQAYEDLREHLVFLNAKRFLNVQENI